MCSVFDSGIRYADFWGHRGFTHSLVFAALMAGVIVVLFRHGIAGMRSLVLWIYFFLVTASHGFLDAMTDGGLGVAFFSPFDNRRFFLPWTPVRVSPIGVNRFFTSSGLVVLHRNSMDLASSDSAVGCSRRHCSGIPW